jgi:hypothetical protein
MILWKSLASSVLLFLVLFVPCTAQADPFVVNFDALDTSGGPVFGAALNGYLAGFGIAITSQVANPEGGTAGAVEYALAHLALHYIEGVKHVGEGGDAQGVARRIDSLRTNWVNLIQGIPYVAGQEP